MNEVLKTNQQVLTWLCICPPDERPSESWMKPLYVLFTLVIIAANLCGLIASSCFFIKFVSSDLEMSLHALLQMFALSAATYMLVMGYAMRHRITDIFRNLSKIYDADANDGTQRFLHQANEQSEEISIKYLKFVLVGFFINTVMMSVVSVLVCLLLNKSFDAKNVYHPFQVLVPWDKQIASGYFYEICFDVIFGDSYLLSNGSLLLLFISICLHHREFSSRFSYSLSKLENTIIGKKSRRLNDEEFVCDILRYHITIKEWFSETADVYSVFILVQLICNTFYSACVAFQLDIQIRNFGFGLIIILISVVVGLSNLFVYCYFGKVATESFAEMAETLYEANWQRFSPNLQKYFILMIGNAHRPLYYHGFGIIILNLETFTKLLRAIFSYYMLFKTLIAE